MSNQIEYQDLHSLSMMNKYKFLRKAFQIVLSLSIFSILMSNPSWLSFFLQSFDVYFSSFPFHLLDRTIDRKYLFLICNGILVFLTTNSGLIGFSSFETQAPSRESHYSEMSYVVQNQLQVQSLVINEENGDLMTIENVDEEQQQEQPQQEQEEEQEQGQEEEKEDNGLLTTMDQVEEEEGEGEEEEEGEGEEEEEYGGFLIPYEEADGGNRFLSTEELNRRCDEFIRKMKEEMRIGAKQQLIMV